MAEELADQPKRTAEELADQPKRTAEELADQPDKTAEELADQPDKTAEGNAEGVSSAEYAFSGEQGQLRDAVAAFCAEHIDEMQGLSLYAATKAGLERLSRDTRRECQEWDIGVTILRPGAAMTEFAAGWDMARLKEAVDAWNKRLGGWMDTGMEPGHVADALVYCLGVPAGVSIDLLEIRPNRLSEKFQF